MCCHRVPVIVIVISRDDSGEGLLKYINVGDKSTMVARLPQQVFLLLALVTGTTMGLGMHGGESPKSTGSPRPAGEDETSGGRARHEMLHKTIDPLDEASTSAVQPTTADDSSGVRGQSHETNERAKWAETRAETTWTYRGVDEFTSPGDESQSIARSTTRESQSAETRETYDSSGVHGTPDEPPSLPVPSTPGYFVLSSPSSSRPSSTLSSSSSTSSMTSTPNSAASHSRRARTSSTRSSNSALSFAVAAGPYTKPTVSTLPSSGNTRGSPDRRTTKLRGSFSDEVAAKLGGIKSNGKIGGERRETKVTRVTHDLRAEMPGKLVTTRENFFDEAESHEETGNEMSKIDGESFEPKLTRFTHDSRAEMPGKLVTMRENFFDEAESQEETGNEMSKIDAESLEPKSTKFRQDSRAEMPGKLVTTRDKFSNEPESHEETGNKMRKIDAGRLEPKLTRFTHDLRAETAGKLVTTREKFSTKPESQEETGNKISKIDAESLEPKSTRFPQDSPAETAEKLVTTHENFSSEEESQEETGNKISEIPAESLEPKSTRFTHDSRAEAAGKLVTTETASGLASSSDASSDVEESQEETGNKDSKIDAEILDPKLTRFTHVSRAEMPGKLVTTRENVFDEAKSQEEIRNKMSKIDAESLEPKSTRFTHNSRAETAGKLATTETESELANSSDASSDEAESQEETGHKISETDAASLEPKLTRFTHDFRAETARKLATAETSSAARDPVKEANVTSSTWRSHRGDQRETRRPVWLTGSRALQPATTLTPRVGLSYPRRYTRDAAENNYCEKFEIGDPDKREFYSPNYPQNYPPLMDCVLVLEAEKGMLLKLDFREQFELEMKTPEGECRFDYLEVRDGQYGFSPRKGIYCDKEFPPEIHSQGRYLWLNFHSDDTIEYRGFKAVWSTVPRPNTAYPPEQEPCIYHVDIPADFELKTDKIKDAKKLTESSGVALDCLWVLQAPAGMKMQLTFDSFKLEKPNDCSANFLDIFDGQTDEPSRLKKFCGSIAEAISTKSNILYIRLYLELKAINSTFSALITAVRDKESNQDCKKGEFDCQDATCIAESLKCNRRRNCRFQRDEDDAECGTSSEKQDRSRIVIILVIFSLIMFGMCSAFVFNCVRKLRRDHRIIREHIRQSREDRLDEIGRRATPCPLSVSRTDLRDGGSESPPGEEVDSSKELIPAAALSARDYTKELAIQMKYGNKEITDIHQSNNVSNATQERLQESSEEPDMCDSSCQTRESLFAPTIPDAILSSPGFSTFGYRSVAGPESNNGGSGSHKGTPTSGDHRHLHHHHNRHQHPPPLRQSQRPSQESNNRSSNSQISSGHPDRCSHEGCAQICPKHNPIPAPPGWSLHDPPYPQILPDVPSAPGENSTYRRYQSPKPEHEAAAPGVYQHHHQHQIHQQQQPPQPQSHHQYPYPHFTRQNTVGSGERYGSFIYGSGRGSSNAPSSNATTTTATTTTNAPSDATGSGSPHSSATPTKHRDPRYRAEAVIEVDQKRPFSIESTKSAPDVIATH